MVVVTDSSTYACMSFIVLIDYQWNSVWKHKTNSRTHYCWIGSDKLAEPPNFSNWNFQIIFYNKIIYFIFMQFELRSIHNIGTHKLMWLVLRRSFPGAATLQIHKISFTTWLRVCPIEISLQVTVTVNILWSECQIKLHCWKRITLDTQTRPLHFHHSRRSKHCPKWTSHHFAQSLQTHARNRRRFQLCF